MKVVGTVINDKFGLEGLVLKGKMKEFGLIGADMVEQAIYVRDLQARKFKNFQIECGEFGVRELGNFKLRDLSMFIITPSGIKGIDNTIKLNKRLLVDGQLRGFEVELPGLGRVAKYKTEDVIKLCKWLKPDNFVVRSTDNKMFVAGKPGMPIDNLPEIELGSGEPASHKASVTAVVNKKDIESGSKLIGNTIDIIGLYDVVDEVGGLIVKMPRTGYKKHTVSAVETGDAFVKLDVGEVGSPRVTFGENKLNANTNFKVIGTVGVNFHGMPQTIYTFVYKTKSVFTNGINNMDKIGLCMKQRIVADVLDIIGESFAVEQITDPNILGPIRAVQGDKDLVMLIADVAKIDLMSADRARKSVMNINDVYTALLDAETLKGVNKYAREVIKESKDAAMASGWKDPRPMYGMYAGYSDEILDILRAADIDVFTGAYVGTQESADARLDAASKLRASIETGEAPVDDRMEIEYSIKGYDIGKYKAPSFGTFACGPYDTPTLRNAVQVVNSQRTVSDVLNTATKILNDSTYKLETIRRKLWMHKVGMFTLGNGRVHQHDKNVWSPIATKKVGGEAYECIAPGCEGLKVILNGVSM